LKKYLIIILIVFFSSPSVANHIAGGEMSYVYLGPGASPNSGLYKITLKLYRDCDSDMDSMAAPLFGSEFITIYSLDNTNRFLSLEVKREQINVVSLQKPDPCIANPPRVCYQIGYYVSEPVELAFTTNGYTIAYQQCCRIKNIFNLIRSEDYGGTYTTNIPGTKDVSNGPINNTPEFKTSDTIIVCANNYFSYDFGAVDADKDKLEYAFVNAYLGAGRGQGQTRPQISSPPPYTSLIYNFGFSGEKPLGIDVTINPTTGLITGVAPIKGIYVVSVGVIERRNGKIINIHRKDLHLKIGDCSVANADLSPTFLTCNGLDLTFKNLSSSPLIKTYDWDFGIPNTTSDISKDPSPTFTFPAPGNYNVRLITNKNDACSDTGYTIAKVFPGFVVNFDVQQACLGVPYNFIDASTTIYGSINRWKWDFGIPSVSNDTAITKNANYVYNSKGNYNVSLIVGNSLGCQDTISSAIVVDDKPFLRVPNDTLLCYLDNMQLNAQGAGIFFWTPNLNISNQNIRNPIVKPGVDTRYTVKLTQSPGCENTASVLVKVITTVALEVGKDTSICLGDSLKLNTVSDGLKFNWIPATDISNTTIKTPIVKPLTITSYSVTASIGSCKATDAITVKPVPYPIANAGIDTVICFGSTLQLNASGGNRYLWSPAAFLNNATLSKPLATPTSTTDFIVAVYDNKGCSRPSFDTVLVNVIPPVKAFAGNDTVVVIGQPLQLSASGGVSYQWVPSSYLSDPSIFNPIASLTDNISYKVKVTTKEGCFAFDDINIKVYKIPPQIFVPTAFTPNGDGLNDVLTPIPVGIDKFIYFKLYNRYGELVFSTTEVGKGWNGIFKGKLQGNESYVWHVKGVDYLGREYFKKGQTTLVRR
jgi:gliding motility-associated-like protein